MIIPSGYAQCTLVFEGVALPFGAVSTFGFTQPGGADDPEGWAVAIKDIIDSSGLMLWLTDDVTLASVRVKSGPNNTGASGEVPAGIVGGFDASTATAQVCYLINKFSPLGGRKGRGRMYLPGVSEGEVAPAGTVSTTIRDNINAALQSIYDDMAPIGDLVLLHNDATVPTALSSWTINARVATQRRRLRR